MAEVITRVTLDAPLKRPQAAPPLSASELLLEQSLLACLGLLLVLVLYFTARISYERHVHAKQKKLS